MMYCVIMKLTVLMPVLIVIYSMNCYGQGDISRVATWVSRRSTDFYRYMGDGSYTICEDPTFMVEEKKCIKNEDILNRCSFTLMENDESIPLVHVHSSKGLIVIDRNQPKNVNASWCQIISLEVHRGANKSTEVNHSGFILTDNNILEIDKNQLAYGIQEYEGELFRVNLSCSLTRKSESDCFFFKMWGATNLTHSKFNSTVPGTLSAMTSTVTTPVTHPQLLTITITSNSTTGIATNVTVLNEKQPSKLEVGSQLFYMVVGAGGGTATLLILCLCCVCVVLVYRQHRIKVSAITSMEMERRISTASRQTEAKDEKETEPGGHSEMSRGKSEEKLECNYAIIPAEKGLDLCDHDCNKEEPLYQEIIPRAELKSSLPQSKETPHASVETAENVFYKTSLHLQHQWKEDSIPCGRPKPFQSFRHFKQ